MPGSAISRISIPCRSPISQAGVAPGRLAMHAPRRLAKSLTLTAGQCRARRVEVGRGEGVPAPAPSSPAPQSHGFSSSTTVTIRGGALSNIPGRLSVSNSES
jgi:hypothetical protein